MAFPPDNRVGSPWRPLRTRGHVHLGPEGGVRLRGRFGAEATGQVGGPAVEPRDRVGYGGVMGGTGVPSASYGQPGGLAVGLGEGGGSATATI